MHGQHGQVIGDAARQTTESGGLGGWIGARVLHLAARLRLGRKDYRQLRHVPLPAGRGVDRIIVSPYGVFVVDTQRMTGGIYGNAEHKAWVQQVGKRKHAFPNPLLQAHRQARMVAAMLGLEAGKVFPVVVFVGSRFATSMPANVTRGGGYVRYLRSKAVPVLTKSEVARIVHQLEERLAHARQGDPKIDDAAKACPQCGSPMVLRDAKKGDGAGRRFWVCSTFPTCRSAIELKPGPDAAPRPAPVTRPAPTVAPVAAQVAASAGPTHNSGVDFGRPIFH
jgi:restriction system protein